MNRTVLAVAGVLAASALVLTACSAPGDAGGDVTITYTNFISNGGNE